MELLGIEPRSRQSTKKLSTCLVTDLVFGLQQVQSRLHYRIILLNFEVRRDMYTSSPRFCYMRYSVYQTSSAGHKGAVINSDYAAIA